MTYSLDYNESLPKVVARLEDEHKTLEPKLNQIEQMVKSGDLSAAIRQLGSVKPILLRHAVEEEARLMRPIMWEFKEKADDCIIILRYHKKLVEFFGHTLASLTALSEEAGRREIRIFLKELRQHHQQEEETLFPLALKANRLYEKSHS
jgi:hypothetical protein